MMGIISIWRNEKLNKNEIELLKRYVSYLESNHHGLVLRVNPLGKKSIIEKIQILLSLKFIPKEVIELDGYGGFIFPAGEAIIRELGGFLYLGVGATKEEFATLKGLVKRIYKFYLDDYFPYFIKKTYHIIDAEFTANYFNRMDDNSTRELFSLSRFKQIKRN
jgi:hypothetical protein